MRKIAISFGIIIFASLFLQVYAQIQPDERLFQEAKILIFDKKWESAQEKLEEILERYPDSPWFSKAFFYRGKCLQEQRGKEVEALQIYKRYIKLEERSESLTEESEISIIDLAYRLYEKGKSTYLREIEKRLTSPNKVIQYYAGFKLSYVEDKRIAGKGIPILKEIVRKERDNELRDRAKIALLRIDPAALKDFEEERYERRALILNIRVYKKSIKKTVLKINIPWALADLALGSIPDKEKELMRKKGYDLDRIIKELTEVRGDIIQFEGEDTIIKIWID